MKKMWREWLKVSEEKVSQDTLYADVVCTLICANSSFVYWLYRSDIWKYVEVLAYHSLGSWHKVEPSDFECDTWVLNKEFMFTFGGHTQKHTILTFFLDCNCNQVRICGVKEVVSTFVKAFNERVEANSFIKEFETAFSRKQ